MVRYSITRDDLIARIEHHRPGWLQRAGKRSESFRRSGTYAEQTTIWHEVKRVFVELQRGKCAYCERLIGMDRLASVEIHLEHFRPKSCVRQWPPAETIAELGLAYDFETGGESAALGYRLLAYHPLNYAAACGTCNSPLKADFFPIGGGARLLDGEDPAGMGAEAPLVIYPIGDIDDDPEALIQFVGYVPVAVSEASEMGKRRARVTIDLFRLGPEQGRDDLIGERALMIRPLYHYLVTQAEGDPAAELSQFAEREIQRLESEGSPHANCARSFVRLFRQNRAMASEVYLRCDEYVSERMR